jgi:hypothetical protein
LQGVEKNNIIKMIHQRKSSKWDGPSEALQIRKILEYAYQENIGRSKRQYVNKSDYWEKDIFSIHSARRRNILAEIVKIEKQCINISMYITNCKKKTQQHKMPTKTLIQIFNCT